MARRMLLTTLAVVLLPGCPGFNFVPIVPWDAFRVDNNPSVSPVAVAAVDMDGDGDIDVVSAWRGPEGTDTAGTIAIHFQSTTGWTTVVIDTNSRWVRVNALATADINLDDRTDIIVAAHDRIVYLAAPEDPTDASEWGIHEIAASIADDFAAWFDVAADQIDGENGLDIVAALADDGRLVWFKSPATPENADEWELFEIDITTRAQADSLVLADLNNDGRVDVISTAPGESTNELSWYQQPADPENDSWTKHPISPFDGATRLAVGDLNGDAKLDVAAISPDAQSVGWLIQPADVTDLWSGWLLADYSRPADDRVPIDVAIADINQDGQNDVIVAAGGTSSGIWWYTPRSNNQLSWSQTTIMNQLNIHLALFDIADVDGDTFVDVVTTVEDDLLAANDRVVWLQNPTTLPAP